MPEAENTQQQEAESGFLKMSHLADQMQDQEHSRPARFEQDVEEPQANLIEMIRDEISERPFQSLAWAATTGLALGLFVAARAMAPRYSRLPFRMPR